MNMNTKVTLRKKGNGMNNPTFHGENTQGLKLSELSRLRYGYLSHGTGLEFSRTKLSPELLDEFIAPALRIILTVTPSTPAVRLSFLRAIRSSEPRRFRVSVMNPQNFRNM